MYQCLNNSGLCFERGLAIDLLMRKIGKKKQEKVAKAVQGKTREKEEKGDINDPLGQAHTLASIEHCFPMKFVLKFVLFCENGRDGSTDERHARKQ